MLTSDRVFSCILILSLIRATLGNPAPSKDHNYNSNHGQPGRRESPKNKDIVFPDQLEMLNRNKTIINNDLQSRSGPPACASTGRSYCEDADDYPSEHIKNLLSSLDRNLRKFFGNDTVMPVDNLANRIDTSGTAKSLCSSKEEIIFPRMAQNKENEWLNVINVKDYQQGVRVENCHTSGKSEPCEFSEYFAPHGYETSCVQKFIYRKLVAVKDGQVQPDEFLLPSCCSCQIQFVGVQGRSATPRNNAVSSTTPEGLPLTIDQNNYSNNQKTTSKPRRST